MQFDDRHNDKTVQEIKQFVARLPEMLADKEALATHTTIAEHIKDITGTDSFLENLQVSTITKIHFCKKTVYLCKILMNCTINK